VHFANKMPSPFDGITIQLDGFTYFACFLVVADFLVVQTHFATMFKSDPAAAESVSIKLLCGLAMLAEFLVISPLFFLSNISASSANVFLLVSIGLSAIQIICFTISIMKTWMIHAKMLSEGRIQSHDTYLRVAIVFIAIGLIGGYFVSFLGIVEFIGFIMYLRVLNHMRLANGPKVVSRMFWGQIASILLGFVAGIILVVMITVWALKTADELTNGGTSTVAPDAAFNLAWNTLRGFVLGILALSVISQWLSLLTTGHFIGDACNPKNPNMENTTNGTAPMLTGTTAQP